VQKAPLMWQGSIFAMKNQMTINSKHKSERSKYAKGQKEATMVHHLKAH
jgi:hypothetical protein